MEASGGNGQAVADEATACKVESPVDEATLAVLGLSIDKGEARVSTPAVLELPADEGEARVGAPAVLGLPADEGEARVGSPAVLGLPANKGEARVGISTGGGQRNKERTTI